MNKGIRDITDKETILKPKYELWGNLPSKSLPKLKSTSFSLLRYDDEILSTNYYMEYVSFLDDNMTHYFQPYVRIWVQRWRNFYVFDVQKGRLHKYVQEFEKVSFVR